VLTVFARILEPERVRKERERMTYRTGFIGATTEAASAWVAGRVEEAKDILVPFAGSCRDIQSMAGEGRHILSYDTQAYSKFIVDGVFAASEVKTNVDKIRYRQGWVYETRPIKNIDERCAGFIDWIADEGTDFDKACIDSAITRSTLMGRMSQWYANIEQLWARFEKARGYNTAFVGQPGIFTHVEGSFFDAIPDKHFDLVQVDPPKIVVGSDIYSANFDWMNKALHGKVSDLPKWNWRESNALFEQIASKVNWDRMIFLYVSGVRPSYEDVKGMLTKYGTIEEEKSFDHRGRTDYGLLLRRTS
jgi:hypothetical protein